MQENELKPCVCGDESPLLHSVGPTALIVECLWCHVATEVFEDEVEAVKEWNKRADG